MGILKSVSHGFASQGSIPGLLSIKKKQEPGDSKPGDSQGEPATRTFQEGARWRLKFRLGNWSETEFSEGEGEEGQREPAPSQLHFAPGKSSQTLRQPMRTKLRAHHLHRGATSEDAVGKMRVGRCHLWPPKALAWLLRSLAFCPRQSSSTAVSREQGLGLRVEGESLLTPGLGEP